MLAYAATLSETVSTILDSIAGCRHGKRPNRSYEHKPVKKWRPAQPASSPTAA